MNPCNHHFDTPAIVYRPKDKEFIHIDQDPRYKKIVCEVCKWKIATRIIPNRKFLQKDTSFRGFKLSKQRI